MNIISDFSTFAEVVGQKNPIAVKEKHWSPGGEGLKKAGIKFCCEGKQTNILCFILLCRVFYLHAVYTSILSFKASGFPVLS